MAQFVTHIQPTLLEASQGHVPHHHSHQVGMQHSSHLPHSGHNLPSPPTHQHHHSQPAKKSKTYHYYQHENIEQHHHYPHHYPNDHHKHHYGGGRMHLVSIKLYLIGPILCFNLFDIGKNGLLYYVTIRVQLQFW